MSVETLGMMGAGVAALAAGLILVRPRFAAATGAGKVLVFGPVLEAVALAIFAAEHFLAARDLAGIVPRWLPAPLFWTYLVGVALLAAAISFIGWRCVRWSATLLALLFLIIVATVDLPNLPANLHDRLFWTLTVRETCFASGAMVLAGSVWTVDVRLPSWAVRWSRSLSFSMPCEHFLFPRFVPGVPLEKLIPQWVPAPVLLSYLVGIVLFAAGLGLMARCTYRLPPPLPAPCFFCSLYFSTSPFSSQKSTPRWPSKESTTWVTRCCLRGPLCWRVFVPPTQLRRAPVTSHHRDIVVHPQRLDFCRCSPVHRQQTILRGAPWLVFSRLDVFSHCVTWPLSAAVFFWLLPHSAGSPNPLRHCCYEIPRSAPTESLFFTPMMYGPSPARAGKRAVLPRSARLSTDLFFLPTEPASLTPPARTASMMSTWSARKVACRSGSPGNRQATGPSAGRRTARA